MDGQVVDGECSQTLDLGLAGRLPGDLLGLLRNNRLRNRCLRLWREPQPVERDPDETLDLLGVRGWDLEIPITICRTSENSYVGPHLPSVLGALQERLARGEQ